MQFRIRDGNAVAFSRAFYRALAAGQSIDGAVADGRLAVFTRAEGDERDWGAPVLHLRAADGVLFPSPTGGAGAGSAGAGAGAAGRGRGTEGVVDKTALRNAIVRAFTTADLELLCSDIEAALAADGVALQVNLDMVGGGTKAVQVLRLIEYLEHRGHLRYLVAAVKEQRPGLIP